MDEWDKERSSQRILTPYFRAKNRCTILASPFFLIRDPLSFLRFKIDSTLAFFDILTRYVQSFGVLALPDVVVNLALHYRIVKISGRVVDDHFRGVVADHLLLINEPPKKGGKKND